MNITCQAAFSQIDITPDFEVDLIGCYREDSRSKGVLHPLYAQVLLLDNNGGNYCLITIDNIGLSVAQSENLRVKVAKLINTDSSHVMLNFSHTHSAPEASSSALNGELYFGCLSERILKCVEDAKAKRVPCKAGWALTSTCIGENRRDGCTVVDDRLGALKLADSRNGDPIAVILRITAHANVLMRENSMISSDYFYMARERLHSLFSCPVMLVQGAAGNIKPTGVNKIFGGEISDLEKVTDILIGSAKGLEFELNDIGDIQMLSSKMDYIADVPLEAEANRIADEAMKTCGIDGTDWLKECERLRKAGISVQAQQGEVQFLKINNGCLCGVAEEIFCEISLEVQEKTHNPLLFFNGYTNGCAGYLPTEAEWDKGGFETLYSYLIYYVFHGHVMPFRKDTAEKLVGFAVDKWKELNTKV